MACGNLLAKHPRHTNCRQRCSPLFLKGPQLVALVGPIVVQLDANLFHILSEAELAMMFWRYCRWMLHDSADFKHMASKHTLRLMQRSSLSGKTIQVIPLGS
ncbi:hypothetical protein FVEG_15215 [Fusarium verticillioides 7600]|uniref:Uncharacterized protein n=1 Tax=Gibberella moniliformis (strain M3125 / FGSC 7600) TaxID=334819 RepID=W7M0J0_GIBM7|nr:hypothetical protein FVEG_15215 [Fusarium verticillioides 7600]EWG41024.1 hypothetical protein FVEG_15215 [Fusarium verticillioides 7600]